MRAEFRERTLSARPEYLDRVIDEYCTILTPQQEVELNDRIRAGDRTARDLLILHNIRLVLKFAGSDDDLIQEGLRGLMRATEDFDPTKSKFSWYATTWIRQYIARYHDNTDDTVRIPVHIQQLMRDQDQGVVLSESNARKVQHARAAHKSTADINDDAIPPAIDQHNHVDDIIIDDLVNIVIKLLSPEELQLYKMKYVEQCSTRIIAERLNLCAYTTLTYVNKLNDKIVNYLTTQGVDVPRCYLTRHYVRKSRTK